MKVLITVILYLAGLVSAQFQFFEQFFQGGQQNQAPQEKQNVASDSSWYRQNWNGASCGSRLGLFHPTKPGNPFQCTRYQDTATADSPGFSNLQQLLVPGYTCLCSFPAPLPMSTSRRRGQS
ncbi:hypothetical protein FOPE_07123 [Fonsecaea pedrosoi]|nr:hypothetical protein FOPE_07123 [Fonsecaea pedrosoi]